MIPITYRAQKVNPCRSREGMNSDEGGQNLGGGQNGAVMGWGGRQSKPRRKSGINTMKYKTLPGLDPPSKNNMDKCQRLSWCRFKLSHSGC